MTSRSLQQIGMRGQICMHGIERIVEVCHARSAKVNQRVTSGEKLVPRRC
jgi:hypothetical protein